MAQERHGTFRGNRQFVSQFSGALRPMLRLSRRSQELLIPRIACKRNIRQRSPGPRAGENQQDTKRKAETRATPAIYKWNGNQENQSRQRHDQRRDEFRVSREIPAQLEQTSKIPLGA